MNKKAKILVLMSTVLALVVTLGDVSSSWTPPTSAIPNGDSNPPLHEGSLSQRKVGSLGVLGIASFGGAVFTGKVQIKNGTEGAGRILVSDGLGNARWVTPPPYSNSAVCPEGTTMRSDGQCGYIYEIRAGGYIACNPGDTRSYYYDSAPGGDRHRAEPMGDNGCFSWEEEDNNGGYACTIGCVGLVRMCMKIVGNDAEWYLSGPDLLCNQ